MGPYSCDDVISAMFGETNVGISSGLLTLNVRILFVTKRSYPL